MEYSPSATVGEAGYWGNKYGSPDTSNRMRIWKWISKNRKYSGNLGGAYYYPVVNKDSGDIAVVNVNPGGDDYSIGTIEKSTGDFKNYAASQEENYYWNLPENANRMKSQALFTANKEYNSLPPGKRPKQTPQQLLYNNVQGNPNVAPTDSSAKGPAVGGLKGVSDSVAKAKGIGGLSGNLGSLFGGIGGGGGAMTYPAGIGGSGQDYMEIAMLIYTPSQVSAGGGGWARTRGGSGGKVSGRVILPIPGGISDSNGVQWGEGKMTAAQTAAAELALSGMEGELGEKGQEIAQKIKNQSGAVKTALKQSIAGAVSNTNQQLMQRTEGQIMNPNMELLFGGPTLRSFTFNFKLSPRNSDESQSIVSIINFFKQNMAPQAVGSNVFLKSPNTWRLTYKHKGGTHRYLNKFKECAMTNCSVQYTDGGNYSTYEDGAMTSYGLALSFQEMEPIFQQDYQGVQGIGY